MWHKLAWEKRTLLLIESVVLALAFASSVVLPSFGLCIRIALGCSIRTGVIAVVCFF